MVIPIRRFRPEAIADRLDGIGSEIAYRAVEKASDAWWDLQGGPYVARYRRSATMAAIGIGQYTESHHPTPEAALDHFRSLPKRYRRNETLRRECLIVYKDNWYCVEPFAEDADDAVEVMQREIARDEGRWHQETTAGSYQDPPARHFGRRNRKKRSA